MSSNFRPDQTGRDEEGEGGEKRAERGTSVDEAVRPAGSLAVCAQCSTSVWERSGGRPNTECVRWGAWMMCSSQWRRCGQGWGVAELSGGCRPRVKDAGCEAGNMSHTQATSDWMLVAFCGRCRVLKGRQYICRRGSSRGSRSRSSSRRSSSSSSCSSSDDNILRGMWVLQGLRRTLRIR